MYNIKSATKKIIIQFSKNAGHLSHFAGHLMKTRDCPAECGTVDTYDMVKTDEGQVS